MHCHSGISALYVKNSRKSLTVLGMMMNWNYNIILMITIFQVFWNEKVFLNSFLCLFSTRMENLIFSKFFFLLFLFTYWCRIKIGWHIAAKKLYEVKVYVIFHYWYMDLPLRDIYTAHSTVLPSLHLLNFISIKGTKGFSETPSNSNNVMMATKRKCVHA